MFDILFYIMYRRISIFIELSLNICLLFTNQNKPYTAQQLIST